MNEGILTMSQRDIKRLHIIQKVNEKSIKQLEAAKVLNLSERQVRRLQRRIEQYGANGIKHGSCGKKSMNATDEKQKEKILGIYRNKYERFGPTLACEKLLEKDKIRISRESLRKWLIAEGLWHKHRKSVYHRHWRERKSHCGQMVQMDGSHHDRLEGRGPKMVLIGFIDDATSRVYGRFYEYEGTRTLEEANEYIDKYLPGFNKRFSVIAAEGEDLHRRLPAGLKLESIFCFRRTHVLRNDFTVADQRRLYQVLEKTPMKEVEVQENLEGQIKIVANGRSLRYKQIYQRQKVELPKKKPGTKRRQPDGGHPWRTLYKPETGRFNFAENRTF